MRACHDCGHEHPVMSSASRGSDIRYYCHEDDHSCYADRNGVSFTDVLNALTTKPTMVEVLELHHDVFEPLPLDDPLRMICSCRATIGLKRVDRWRDLHVAHQADVLAAAGFGDVAIAWEAGYGAAQDGAARKPPNPYQQEQPNE